MILNLIRHLEQRNQRTVIWSSQLVSRMWPIDVAQGTRSASILCTIRMGNQVRKTLVKGSSSYPQRRRRRSEGCASTSRPKRHTRQVSFGACPLDVVEDKPKFDDRYFEAMNPDRQLLRDGSRKSNQWLTRSSDFEGGEGGFKGVG